MTDQQAAALLAQNGPNAISPPKKKSLWLQFLSHLLGLFNLLLIVSGALSFILFAIDPASMVNVRTLRVNLMDHLTLLTVILGCNFNLGSVGQRVH